jgi:hypothetical protein
MNLKMKIMKKVTNWFELLIENTVERKNSVSTIAMILLVLLIGAGSLYMLLNPRVVY